MQDPVQKPQPLEFRTEEQFLEYLNHPRYELDEDRPGVCFALQIEDNTGDRKREKTSIKVKYHTEMTFGRPPTGFSSHDPITSQ
mmetsp:Transcript_8590/g.13299  ORF Transcript_8590/g.13299 Transcript_8590/m.13299 type:complete len:84 (+) Transcript_8590:700-951(+)